MNSSHVSEGSSGMTSLSSEDGLHPGLVRIAVLRVVHDVVLNMVGVVGVSFSVVGVLDVGHCVEVVMKLC